MHEARLLLSRENNPGKVPGYLYLCVFLIIQCPQLSNPLPPQPRFCGTILWS